MKLRLLILSVALSLPVIVAAQGLDTAKIDEAMGRSGQQDWRCLPIRISPHGSSCVGWRRGDKARTGTRLLGGVRRE